ncbi:MAG: hypothetical protein WD022_00625 [Balneolaceae bacterium]
MNILVGDSGASKTDWVLLSDSQPQFIQTDGLNPHLLKAPEFMDVLTKELKPNLLGKAIGQLHFFGAGCGSPQKKKEVEKFLDEAFEFTEIHVKTDLDGAGLALFGEKKEGIVCILGSGSSAGFFQDGNIVNQMPSVAYPHGDEGSGSDIGKKLLESYLRNKMDARLREYFEKEKDLDLENLFYLLQQPKEAKLFVADVCRIFSRKSSHSQIQQIIYDGFCAFMTKTREYFSEEIKDHQVGFVGSVASVYEGELRACAKQMEIEITSVIRSPIEHLALHFGN